LDDESDPFSAMERWPAIGEPPGCPHCGVDIGEYIKLASRCIKLEDEVQKLRAEISTGPHKA
jgi:hypothetical protein